MELAAAKPADCLVRIGTAVENQNATVRRLVGSGAQVKRESRATVALVTTAPLLGPPVNFLHRMGQESLLGIENALIFREVHLAHKSLVNRVRRPCFEAEDRGIPHGRSLPCEAAHTANPVMNHAVFARHVVEKGFQIRHYRYVEVEKKRGALQLAEAIGSDEELGQHVGPTALEARVGRERNDANLRVEAFGVLGAAMEKKRTLQMLADRPIEGVDVVRPVAVSPFKSDNVTDHRK